MKRMALRLPDEMHTALVDWAKRERHSVHAQILWLLQQAIAEERSRTPRQEGGTRAPPPQ
jgi:hypothetical protein